MQIQDVSAVWNTAVYPNDSTTAAYASTATDPTGVAPAARTAAEAQAAASQSPLPLPTIDVIALSPDAALRCGSAVAP